MPSEKVMPYKLLIADDHRMFSEALCELLKPTYQSVSQVFDGSSLIHCVGKEKPDLILLDINLPRLNGLLAAEQLRKTDPTLKIIIVSMYNHASMIATAKKLALNGYVLKDSSSQMLLDAIENVLEGRQFFDPKLQKKFEGNDTFSNQWILTNREKEIVQKLVSGTKAEVIASELGLSYETIKSHRKNIYLKLEINSLAELIHLAGSWTESF